MAKTGAQLAAAVAAGVLIVNVSHGHLLHASSPAPSPAAARAVAYAWAQVGKPYCWAGNGPSCYDCSGLMQQAWASAGVSIPRTTFKEWASLPHVPASQAEPGDLVLAPGSDGSMSSPGHVGMLLPHRRVLQAYATGYNIAVTSLRRFAAAAGGIVGYARPGGG